MEDKVIVQNDFDSLFDWGKTCGLSFNVSKCNNFYLARHVAKTVRFYALRGEVISSVFEAEYLGLTLSINYSTETSHVSGSLIF